MYTYTIECNDGSLYAGVALDVRKRMQEHLGLEKGGAKYTKSRPPVRILAVWKSENRSTASKLEFYIKKLTRNEKLRLVSSYDLALLNSKINAIDYSLELELIGNISDIL
jgi:putative endonuclease